MEEHFGWITQRQAVSGNVADDDAVGADDGAFTDGDAFHDVRAIADPGVFAYADRADVARVDWGIGDAQIGLARVAVAVGDAAIEGDAGVFLDDHFAIYGDGDVPGDFGAILDDEQGLVKEAAGGDADFAAEPHVVTDVNLGVAFDVGQAVNGDVVANASATALPQGLAIEGGDGLLGEGDDAVMKVISKAEQRLNEAGEARRGGTEERAGKTAGEPEKSSVAPL